MASENYRAPSVAQSAELAEQQGEREQFEAWCGKSRSYSRDRNGNYIDEFVADDWELWKAALAATGKQQVGENPAWRDELIREAHARGLMEGLNHPRRRQVIEVQGDARAQFEVFDQWALKECPAWEQDHRDAGWEAWQAALAARQPGAQEPVAVVTTSERFTYGKLNRAMQDGTQLYAAPPAQGIDLGQFRDAFIRAKVNAGAQENQSDVDAFRELLALIDQRDAGHPSDREGAK